MCWIVCASAAIAPMSPATSSGTLPEQEFRGTVHAVEHHLCHLASAFLVSPYDKAVAVSVDGFGDFSSAAWGLGEGGTLSVDGRVYFPHSLGVFYEAMTQFIGFPHYGDEYKVMGLAPYGEPRYVDAMKQIVKLKNDGAFALDLRYFRHAAGEGANYQVKDGIPSGGKLWSDALTELLGPARDPAAPLEDRERDIARSAQVTYENAFFNLLQAVHQRYDVDAVVLAGGCAYNSVANGKVLERSPFKKLYVQSAGGDAGGAIGAAFATWHRLGGAAAKRHFVMDHAYWGPSATPDQIAAAIDARRADFEAAGCTIERIGDEATLCRRTAQAISEGKVIGWFQGRLEWGPRALGNRSILGDPRRADMKDILNLKIKRREVVPAVRAVDPARCRAGMVRDRRRRAVHDAGVPHPRGEAQGDPGGHPCRRQRPPADRDLGGQPALCAPDRSLPRHYRRADRAQHQLQRERTGRLQAGGSHRLFPAHQDGRSRAG